MGAKNKGTSRHQENQQKPPILRYVPLSQRKKGESPFMPSPKNLMAENVEVLKENYVMPLTKMAKAEQRHEKEKQKLVLPDKRIEGFDQKAYKLLTKAGYDFTLHTEFKGLKIFDQRPELSSTQKKLLKEGYVIPNSRIGLGYKTAKPVCIIGKGKKKVADTCHITVEETKDLEEDDSNRGQRTSVFDRITLAPTRPSAFQRLRIPARKNIRQQSISNSNRLSVFQRLNTPTATRQVKQPKFNSARPSVFQRLSTTTGESDQACHSPITKPSAFERLNVSKTHALKGSPKSGPNTVSGASKANDVHSTVPSRMKRKLAVSINTEGSLKVKCHNIVITKPEGNTLEDEENVSNCYHVLVQEVKESLEQEDDADEAPLALEDGSQSTIDELKEINLGTLEEPRPTFISMQLTNEEEEEYVNLLIEYKDIFAWSYKEMSGLDPKIAAHRLAIKSGYKPIKQAQRRFRPELIPQIEEEVNKLIDAGFIREVKYPTWIANIVPVRKKNGQLRVCVDFRDLNIACPKDDFPWPITEIMVDATMGHEALSFMDESSGYNQIHMALEDEEKTAFRTPKRIYCYKVMPFGLKNA